MTNAPLQAEIERALNHNEARLASKYQTPAPLHDEEARQVEQFGIWCRQHGVRGPCPARPASCAAFLDSVPVGDVFTFAEAIRLAHQARGLACPIASECVRAVLGDRLKIKPPRTWRRHEQSLFVSLPVEVRAAIERRERENAVELRRLQNRVAAFRDSAVTKPVNNSENEENYDHSQA